MTALRSLKCSNNFVAIAFQFTLPVIHHVPVQTLECYAVCLLQFLPKPPENVANSCICPVIAPASHDFIAFNRKAVLVCGVVVCRAMILPLRWPFLFISHTDTSLSAISNSLCVLLNIIIATPFNYCLSFAVIFLRYHLSLRLSLRPSLRPSLRFEFLRFSECSLLHDLHLLPL